MPLLLRPLAGDARSFPVLGALRIGRGTDNEVCVPHASLSRSHAAVVPADGGGAWVEDRGSKNGTYVNGKRVLARVRVDVGDEVRCGEIAFRIERDIPGPTLIRAPESGSPTMMDLVRQRSAEGPAKAERRLRILLESARLLSEAGGPDPFERIVALATEIFAADSAVLLTEDADGPKTALVRGRESSAPYSRSVVDWVRRERQAGLFADASLDPRLDGASSIVAHAIFTAMAAPLLVGGDLIGVLYVDQRRPGAKIGEDDLDLLVGFASQAAVAMHNRQLTRRLHDEAVARAALTRFFPPAIVPTLLQGHGAGLGVVETRVTAMFCDIAGYTALSATLTPMEVMRLLNQYFPIVAEAVFRHGGTLEKYIGDAALAVWGAPFAQRDDADRALAAAIEIRDAVEGITTHHGPLRVHVGLNTGVVAAGNVGTHEFIQYVTVGDATNVAARICNVAAAGEVVASETTWAALTLPRRGTALPPAQVKGKADPLVLWRVDG